MDRFNAISLGWAGKTYAIPADRVLGAIARVENHVTLEELIRFQEKGTIPFAKIAQGYAAVLQYAGAKVSADDVYAGMLGADEHGDAAKAVAGLLHMMVPPERLVENAPKGNAVPAGAGLSSKPIKRRSGRNGSRQANSGH